MKKCDIEKVLSLLADTQLLADDDALSAIVGKCSELRSEELDAVVAAAQNDRARLKMLLDRIENENNND